MEVDNEVNRGSTFYFTIKFDIANNGLEALSLYDEKQYDVIFMDIQMPGMDGIDVAARIREKEGSKRHTPIVALTAHALQGGRERFMPMGMDECIAKSIDMDELFIILDKICDAKVRNSLTNGNIGIEDGNKTMLNKNSTGRSFIDMDMSLTEEITEAIKELEVLIKSSDFSLIELAARRGNMREVIEYFVKITREHQTFKKSFSEFTN